MLDLDSETQAALLGALLGGAIGLFANYLVTRMQQRRGQRDKRREVYIAFTTIMDNLEEVSKKLGSTKATSSKLRELQSDIRRMSLLPDNMQGLADIQYEVKRHQRKLDEIGVSSDDFGRLLRDSRASYQALYLYAPRPVRYAAFDLLRSAYSRADHKSDNIADFTAARVKFTWLTMNDVRAPGAYAPLWLARLAHWSATKFRFKRQKPVEANPSNGNR